MDEMVTIVPAGPGHVPSGVQGAYASEDAMRSHKTETCPVAGASDGRVQTGDHGGNRRTFLVVDRGRVLFRARDAGAAWAYLAGWSSPTAEILQVQSVMPKRE